jgi:hypothetical protein
VNAATVTALTIPEAHALLHMAMELPEPRHPDIEAGIDPLEDALAILAALDSGVLEWDWVWPAAGSRSAGFTRAASEVISAAGKLFTAMAEHCLDELEAVR